MPRKEIDPQLPYIQLHRNAVQRSANLATILKLPVPHVLGAMCMFWVDLSDRRTLEKHLDDGRVLLSKEDAEGKLRIAFGQTVSLEDLCWVGFLEKVGELYRVRGMSRQLGVEKSRKGARKGVSGTPRGAPGSTPGVTEVRGERREVKDEKEKETTAPRLSDQIVSTYKRIRSSEMLFQPRDGVALAQLQKTSNPQEILKRWERGLQGEGWLRVSTVTQLVTKWNDLDRQEPRQTNGNGPPLREEPPPLPTFTDAELDSLYAPGGIYGFKPKQ